MDRIILHCSYTRENGDPREFAYEMQNSGLQAEVKAEEGCIEYDYYAPLDGSDKVLLVEGWQNDELLERHKNSDIMAKIRALKDEMGIITNIERFD